MMRGWWLVAGASLAVCPVSLGAQTRTRWEMNAGDALVRFPSPQPMHGGPSEYDFARIPSLAGAGWIPAPDPNAIQYDVRSTLCGASIDCLDGAEFTYFRSTICIPDPRDLGSVTVRIGDVDDGARVTVFNSMFPMGFTPSNGYAFLGGGSIVSGDFASRLRVGEPNTLVITHVDDCCVESRLRDVTILANGSALPATVPTERCNGLDDDCNGRIDEGLGATSCGVGACARTIDNCVSGRPQTCAPGAPRAEVCDGVDNDCDGALDEDLGTTTCGVGACRVTVANCARGMTVACVAPAPRAEACNGLDDDCDGVIDNTPTPCDAGVATDVPLDAPPAPDACTDYRCDPDLRLGGRAGPIGDCQCEAAPSARARWPHAWLALAALTTARRPRRPHPRPLSQIGRGV